ncbi:MAG: hypothetical protein WAK17_18845 [Candidatus Nitrosopolaris sp.]
MVKSLGDKAVYRVEESLKMHSCLVDVLHTIRSPRTAEQEKIGV